MKASSVSAASKKVVASALSAAMVVALAPAVALADATGDAATAVASVTSADGKGVRYCATLGEALSSAKDGETVTQLKDVTVNLSFLKSALGYAYADGYTYGGTVAVSGNKVYYSCDNGGATMLDDVARYLGALYRFDGGKTVSSITYKGKAYTWDAGEPLLGSNWAEGGKAVTEGEGKNTLVSAITADYVASQTLPTVVVNGVEVSFATGEAPAVADALYTIGESVTFVGKTVSVASPVDKLFSISADAYDNPATAGDDALVVRNLGVVSSAPSGADYLGIAIEEASANKENVELVGVSANVVAGSTGSVTVKSGAYTSVSGVSVEGGTFAGKSSSKYVIDDADTGRTKLVVVTELPSANKAKVSGGTFASPVMNSVLTGGTYAVDPGDDVYTTVSDKGASGNTMLNYAARKNGAGTYDVVAGIAAGSVTVDPALAAAGSDALAEIRAQLVSDSSAYIPALASAADGAAAVSGLDFGKASATDSAAAVAAAKASLSADQARAALAKAPVAYAAGGTDDFSKAVDAVLDGADAKKAATTCVDSFEIAASATFGTVTAVPALGGDLSYSVSVSGASADDAYTVYAYDASAKKLDKVAVQSVVNGTDAAGASNGRPAYVTFSAKTGTFVMLKSSKSAAESSDALDKLAAELGLPAGSTLEDIQKAAERNSGALDEMRGALGLPGDADLDAVVAAVGKAQAAAEKLVKLQDKVAVGNAVGRTVTVSRGKGKVFTLKKIVSASGAKVTYKKANTAGKSRITVSSAGKVTVKKGLKKGTYKVKVKAACGSSCKYVTAKVVVR